MGPIGTALREAMPSRLQVLRLLHYLVSYGYYSDAKDIKALLVPLLSLLDGKNDKPFKITRSKENSLMHTIHISLTVRCL